MMSTESSLLMVGTRLGCRKKLGQRQLLPACWLAIVLLWLVSRPSLVGGMEMAAPALSSLQSYTGLINMPNARVLPDWRLRFGCGSGDPYRYYGAALGLWDRLEFHGQFTEVTTIEAFAGEGYGYYKDRAAGFRLVLLPEEAYRPQVAVGAFDFTGTALFATRYLAASKMWGNIDLTLGLGQGILAGEFMKGRVVNGVEQDVGYSFLFSSPNRPTKAFGGLEWHLSPRVTTVAEFSSLDLANTMGYRDRKGAVVKADESRLPVNIGLKYQANQLLNAQVSYLGGSTLAGGVNITFPLGPEGMLPWKKVTVRKPGEGERWQAHATDNKSLAAVLAEQLKGEGFDQAVVSCSESAVWIEAVNSVHLSSARAMGHIFKVVDGVLPERIVIVYLNLRENGQVVDSLRTTRANMRAYVGSYQDTRGFLAFADLDLYGNEHWREYVADDQQSPLVKAQDDALSYSLAPKVRTFLNNKRGFFKHKGVLRGRGEYELRPSTSVVGEFEVPFFNQFEQLDFNPLERDAVRTDLVRYEEKSAARMTSLALNHTLALPYQVEGRLSAGYFESAYAGFGGECFRFFHDGLWGVGLEAEAVRKRSLNDDFAMSEQLDQWFKTGFVNLYAQLWPEQGLEGGIKFGRFLAGDPGVRVDLRRSFRYFTIGAWYTKTDTSLFQSLQNRESDQQGVYISIPLSLFSDHDRKGHIEYDFASFTRDSGALVQQPRGLYPMDPWSTPSHLRHSLEEMRGM